MSKVFLKTMMVFALAATGTCILASKEGIADQQMREIKELNLIMGGLGGKIGPLQMEVLPYDQFMNKSSLTLVSPHPAKNPKHEMHKWSGVFVKDLFTQVGFKFPDPKIKGQDSMVTLIASDNYNVEMPVSDVSDPGVLIATERNDQKISWYDGGPQMVHPISNPKIRAIYKGDSWWSWYVKAIVIGQLEPRLEVKGEGQTRSILLTSEKNPKKATFVPMFPAGQKQALTPKNMVVHSFLFLKDLLESNGLKAVGKLKIETLNDKTTELDLSKGDYRVIFKVEGHPVKTVMGGPVQICSTLDKADINNCIFYVRGLILP